MGTSWDTDNLSGPNAEDDKPWYNNDWTDWIHPLALIAYYGATQGERIGNGIGVFSVGQLETSMDIAELRKSRALERLGDADSPISVQEAQDEQRRACLAVSTKSYTSLAKSRTASWQPPN